jgi:hypothetical protein
MTPERDKLQKYFADLRRVCEVEDTVVEWFDYLHAKNESLTKHIRRHLELDQFKNQFKIHSVEVGGIDFSVWKLELETLPSHNSCKCLCKE